MSEAMITKTDSPEITEITEMTVVDDIIKLGAQKVAVKRARPTGLPEIDLSFMGLSVIKKIGKYTLSLPKFVYYKFYDAHSLENTFSIRFGYWMMYEVESYIAKNNWFHIQGVPGGITLNDLRNPDVVQIVKAGQKIAIAKLSADRDCDDFTFNKYIVPSLYAPSLYEYIDLKINSSPWGFDKFIVSATYNGVIPVPVQQLVHKASRQFDSIYLIAEADWENAKLEITPIDPLVVGYKKKEDKFYLLCKFDETIEENYYASEFTKGNSGK